MPLDPLFVQISRGMKLMTKTLGRVLGGGDQLFRGSCRRKINARPSEILPV